MNKLLGELEIMLDGQSFVLKPTFEAIVMMEEKSNRTISQLWNTFMSMQCGIKDVTAVIYSGMYGKNGNKTSGLPLTFEQVGEKIMNMGVLTMQQPCLLIIGSIYSGKPIDEAVKMREAAKEKAHVKDEKSGNEPPPQMAESTGASLKP